jgi:hypothetical protein
VSAFSLGSRPARIARRPCFGPNCARPTNGESETRSVGEKSRQLGRAGARCRRAVLGRPLHYSAPHHRSRLTRGFCRATPKHRALRRVSTSRLRLLGLFFMVRCLPCVDSAPVASSSSWAGRQARGMSGSGNRIP